MIKTLHIIKRLLPLTLLGLVAVLLPVRANAAFIVNGGTVTLANDTVLTSIDEIRLTSGGLIANSAEIILGSTWTRTNATFTQGTSTVTFMDGSDKALAGSTTFYALRFTGVGYTLRFTAGTTQYVTGPLDLQDIFLRSTTNNATWYIRQSSGPAQTLLGLDVKDSNAIGGRVMVASNTINSGNNRNWSFPILDLGERYWVGSTAGMWNNTANWSLLSNGPGGYQVPLASHTVIFDGGGSKNGNATVNTNVNIATLTVSGYTGTLNFNGYNITVATALYHDSGTLNFSTSPITLPGDFVRTGGNFSAGGSTVTFSGTKNQTLTTNTTNFTNVIVNKAGGTISIADELIVTGQWTNTSGTSVDNSTVTFAGTIQQLSGSTTFFAMRAITNGATLYFTPGTTQYATNMIDWQDLTLRSATNNATWYFEFNGTNQNILDVNVRDSNARSGATLFADTQSSDLGNNWNWAFNGTNPRYWVSGSAGSWSSVANWSYASGGAGGAPVPTSTHTVIFDGRGLNGNALMTSNVTVTTITIAGYTGTVNTQGYTFTVSNAFIQSSGGIDLSTSTLDIKGDFTYTAGTFDAAAGATTTITGTAIQDLTSGGVSFFHFLFNKTGGSLTLNDALDIDGQFSYTAGTFNTNSKDITVTGDWRQNAANFTISNTTVTFNSATRSTLFGHTTFYALRALTPNTTIYFNWGSTTQVTGIIDLEDVYLRSTLNNATWYLRVSASSQTLIDVNVRDSNANNGFTLYPDAASTNISNNRNWAFDGPDARYWVCNAPGLWNASACWSRASGGQGGAPVPISTQSAIFDGYGGANGNVTLNGNVTIATITLAGYASTATLALNGYVLTVTDAYNQSSGIINLGTTTLNIGGTLNRTGGTWTVGSSTVAFTGAGNQIINPNSNTFFNLMIDKPSGTAELAGPMTITGSFLMENGTFDTTAANYPFAVTSEMDIDGGTFIMNDSTISVSRNWVQTGGTVLVGGSTVTFTGGNTQLLRDFNAGNVIINKTAGTRAQVIGSMTVDGNFTLTQGTFTPQGYSVSVTSNMVQANGTLYFTTSTISLGGGFTRSGGTFFVDASTMIYNGAADCVMNTGTISYFNLVVNKTGGVATAGAALTVLGNFTLLNGELDTNAASNFALSVTSHVRISGGTFDMNNSAITVQKNWVYTAGTMNIGNSTVNFTGGNLQSLEGGGFGNIVVNKTAGTILDVNNTVNIGGRFTMTQGTFTTGGFDVYVSSFFLQANGTVYLGSSTVSFGGSISRTAGSFYADASTVVFTGSLAQTINTGVVNFFNVVIDKPSGTASPATTLNVLGSLSLLSGDLDTTASNFPVNVSSHVIISGGTFDMNNSTMNVSRNWTYNSGILNVGNSTVTFTGTFPQAITSNGSAFENIHISKGGGTLTLNDALSLDGQFNYTAGTFDSNDQAITVTGGWRQNAANLTLNGSTVTFNNPIQNTLFGHTTFYGFRALQPNATIYFTWGSTTQITGMIDVQNVYLRSTLTNATWYLRMSGTNRTILGVEVRDSNAANGNTLFPDPTSVNSGNNRNWAFGSLDTRYWVRTSPGMWNDTDSWSYTSGGSPGAPIPLSTQTVVFDGVGGNSNATLNGDVTVSTLTVSGYSGALALNGYTLTVSSAFNQTTGVVNLGTSTFEIGGTLNRTAGTFNANASTVAFIGAADQIVNANNVSFFNLAIDKPNGLASLAGALNVNGSLFVNSSTLTTTGSNYPITVSSHVVITGGHFDLNAATMNVSRNWTQTGGVFDAGTSTVDFVGGNTQNLSADGNDFFHLNVTKTAGTRLQLIGDLNVNGHFTLNQGTFTTQGYDVTVSTNFTQVNGTLYLSTSQVSIGGNLSRTAGSFYADASTVAFTGGRNQTINSAGMPFFNVVVNKSANTASPTTALTVLGSLTLEGGDLDTTGSNFPISVSSHVAINGGTFDMNNSTITVGRNWTVTSGATNVGNSTVTFTGALSQSILSNGSSFDNIIISKSGSSLTLLDALDLTGQFNYSAGTFDSNNQAIAVGGDWRQNAVNLTLNGSTVTFNNPIQNTLSGHTTFYGLRALQPTATIYFTWGSTTQVTNMLDVENVYLRSTLSNATWYLRMSGADQTVINVDVRDSNANNGNAIVPTGGRDLGNNRNWDFSGPAPITTLAGAVTSTSSVTLTWTATADAVQNPLDGTYRIQYSTFPITFSTANAQVVLSTTNVTPGDLESTVVTNLASNTTYFFRIWLGDSRPNWSTLSNGTTVTTFAKTVTNIVVSDVDTSSVTFTWTPRALTPSAETAKSYVLELATNAVFDVLTANFNSSNVSQSSWAVSGLVGGNTYFFRIGSLNWSNATNYAVAVSTLLPISRVVELSTDTIVLGGLTNMNTQIIITTSVVVTNRGNIPATFEFRAATITVGSPWIISPSQSVDQYVVWAVINSTQPATANFANEDRLSNTFTPCTSSAFTMGNEDGISVPAGTSRTIWFQLGTPTATSTAAPQSIQVKGRAN